MLSLTIAQLRAAFPRQEFSETSERIYCEALADLDERAVAVAIHILIRTADFLPSIASIRRQAALVQLRVPNANDAWLIANSPISRPVASPVVKAAIEAVGGVPAFDGDDDALRRRFLRAYNTLCDACISSIAEVEHALTS